MQDLGLNMVQCGTIVGVYVDLEQVKVTGTLNSSSAFSMFASVRALIRVMGHVVNVLR